MPFSCCSKVIVSLRYADLVSVLPTRVRVIAWPIDQFKKSEVMGAHPIPSRLSYAEDALKSMSLPEGDFYPKMLSFLFSNWKSRLILIFSVVFYPPSLLNWPRRTSINRSKYVVHSFSTQCFLSFFWLVNCMILWMSSTCLSW